MRRAKSVIHIDFSVFGEFFGEVNVILLLLLVEAKVLEHDQVPALHLCCGRIHFRADAITHHTHRFALKNEVEHNALCTP